MPTLVIDLYKRKVYSVASPGQAYLRRYFKSGKQKLKFKSIEIDAPISQEPQQVLKLVE